MAGNFRIDINTQTLKDTSRRVTNINNCLDDQLTRINRLMNETEADWQSDAGREIREAMDALRPRFEQYKEVVTAYARFLEDTAQSYENTESSIQSNASAFRK